jgi:hypothetical protein
MEAMRADAAAVAGGFPPTGVVCPPFVVAMLADGMIRDIGCKLPPEGL